MTRFFVEKIDDPPVLTGEPHKHLSVVLRARAGDEIVLCDNSGYECVCDVVHIERDKTVLSLREKRKGAGEPNVRVTLFFSLLKGDKADFVVQKATELGVTELVPLVSRYVVAPERNVRRDRLQKIACEAAQQCGRSVCPRVAEKTGWAQMLSRLSDFDTVVFPYEKAVSPSLRAFLRRDGEKDARSIAVIVGCEGGFSEEEAEDLRRAGVTPVTLGKRILRAETANLAVLAAVMYERGQWE